ncbi:hypothetical protein BH09BAC6_BH09BAC6_09710 [soil metagenome]|jgi:hypothetical protein
MRTSLIETGQIDMHLLKQGTTEDRLLFEAMLLLDPALNERVQWQQKAHEMITQYGRKQLKAEIAAIHQQLFSGPKHQSFRNKIWRLFKAG